MRPRFLVLALALGLGCAHARAFDSSDRAAIVELLRAQQDAWNRGDLDAFLRAYDPGPALIFTSSGRVRRGYAETRARYQARYQSDPTAQMGRLDFKLLDLRALGADGAIVLGRWRLSATPQAGEGVFSLAFLRTPAGWRIVHDHTSLIAP
ncbi:MAG: nuclear transport factor 2 family protein [Nannocystis sp.]|nr:nuclear transport factor 2 family protein [Nannocystis sp.]MBA3545943.1 nuclear transport factor 2 family protein [Nannocystis sp.]